MENKKELISLCENRERIYHLLGHLYLFEIDEKMLGTLRTMVYPISDVFTELSEGFEMLTSAVCAPVSDEASFIVDMEVDYARIFLAAGVAQGLSAFPYESVYTSKKRLMVQESCEDVAILYAAKGLKAREDMYKVPDDHIGLEFAYMAKLCKECIEAIEVDDEAAMNASFEEQKVFLKGHLLNWALTFASDVNKYAQTDVYKALSKITRGFLSAEKQLLA